MQRLKGVCTYNRLKDASPPSYINIAAMLRIQKQQTQANRTTAKLVPFSTLYSYAIPSPLTSLAIST